MRNAFDGPCPGGVLEIGMGTCTAANRRLEESRHGDGKIRFPGLEHDSVRLSLVGLARVGYAASVLRASCVAVGIALASCGGNPGPRREPAADEVTQYHNHASRDGLYVAPALSKTAAAKLRLDASFRAKMQGPTLAQPLYVEKGPQGKAAFIVATERNTVYAFDADSGDVLWQTPPLGEPVLLAALPCGNIDPLGITGTPFVDVCPAISTSTR